MYGKNNAPAKEPRTCTPPRASRMAMRLARPTVFLGLTALLFGIAPASCNTSAVGIEECQTLEYARCEAAVHCPNEFSLTTVAACKRFYRDQCLHGLDLSKAPSKADVDHCTSVIGKLGECARTSGEKSAVVACQGLTSTETDVKTVCELLRAPQATPACDFLIPPATGGSGGEGGTSSTSTTSTGGTSSTSTTTATGGDAGTAGTSWY